MRIVVFPSLIMALIVVAIITLTLAVGSALGGDMIAYTARCSGTTATAIYVADLQREWAFRVTALLAEQPSWSPDGREIVHTRLMSTSNYDLYVSDRFGDHLRRLTIDPADDINPAWSPDGSRIAFVSDRRGIDAEIYMLDLDGDEITRLTRHSSNMSKPDWTPDGASLIVSSFNENGLRREFFTDLFIVDAHSGAMSLTQDSIRLWHFEPDVSPDGLRVAFGALDDEIGYHLRILTSGQTESLITFLRPGSFVRSPRWSPDGKRIAFIVTETNGSIPGTRNALRMIRDDGMGEHQFDLPCNVVDFSWRP
jgi:Tol biopolymer transport system component